MEGMKTNSILKALPIVYLNVLLYVLRSAYYYTYMQLLKKWVCLFYILLRLE